MRRAVSYLPLALLFLASAVPSNGQMRRAEPEVTKMDWEVTVKLGAPLTVECPLRPDQVADWRRDGGDIPRDMKPVEAPAKSSDALTAKLTAPEAFAHHAGVYTCAKASPRIHVKVTDAETTVAAEAEVLSTDEFTGEDLYYDVRGNFQLNCTIGGKISWKKNGTDISEFAALAGHVITKPLNGVENGQLTLGARATENDFGNYTCANGDGQQMNWKVKARPHAKLPPDSNVVEGQKLKLTCKIIGRPYPQVLWTYNNVSVEENSTIDVITALGESRVKLSTSEQGVPDGELVIERAERTDAGYYRCTPADPQGKSSTTTLRVKDMYAALWPFLGICAEVFILCAIILVYEKRRTKPELDDSDTDNHDQKKS